MIPIILTDVGALDLVLFGLAVVHRMTTHGLALDLGLFGSAVVHRMMIHGLCLHSHCPPTQLNSRVMAMPIGDSYSEVSTADEARSS